MQPEPLNSPRLPPSSDVGKKVPRRSISCLFCWEVRRKKRARPRVWREGTDPESELSLPPCAAAKQGLFSIGGMSPVLRSTLPFRCGGERVHGGKGTNIGSFRIRFGGAGCFVDIMRDRSSDKGLEGRPFFESSFLYTVGDWREERFESVKSQA